MRDSLRRLTELMPPLPGQRHTIVDWKHLETCVGLPYPQSFKDFVSVYGSSHWFDKLVPIYALSSTPEEVADFLNYVAEQLNWIKGNQHDEKYKELDLPLYPTKGGLFPFMNDIDGPLYCWRTEGNDPDQWPVYCWLRGQIVILKNLTICEMLTGYFERSPEIVQVWGDIQELEPHRLCIDDCCAD